MAQPSKFLPDGFDPTRPVALIAGQGLYPVIAARALREARIPVRLVAFAEETPPDLVASFPEDERRSLLVGQLGRMLRALKELGAGYVLMAGQITPRRLFRGLHPDLKATRILLSLKRRNAETIFGAIAAEIEALGIAILDARAFLDGEMATPGVMTGRDFPVEEDYLTHGIHIARECARLDIGQGCVVRKGTVLAIEAFEGTDEMLRRAGSFKAEGAFFVKTVKAGQDFALTSPVSGSERSRRCARAASGPRPSRRGGSSSWTSRPCFAGPRMGHLASRILTHATRSCSRSRQGRDARPQHLLGVPRQRGQDLCHLRRPIRGHRHPDVPERGQEGPPLTHDLMGSILLGLEARLDHIIINDAAEGTFYARIYLTMENELGKKIVEIDARPSDSIVLAIQQKRPIYVARQVFDADTTEDMTKTFEDLLRRQAEEGGPEKPPAGSPRGARVTPTPRALRPSGEIICGVQTGSQTMWTLALSTLGSAAILRRASSAITGPIPQPGAVSVIFTSTAWPPPGAASTDRS